MSRSNSLAAPRKAFLIGSLATGMTVALAPALHAQSCSGDLTDDGVVDGADLGIQLASWGPCAGCAADIDQSGSVDGLDVAFLLAGWGECPGIPDWATVVQYSPDATVVTDPELRAAIVATGLPWRVRDTATQIEMLLVPPGTFQMGCVMGSDLHACSSFELPVHPVTLTQPFYLGRYEVTQAQWTERMGSNPSNFKVASSQVSAAEVPNRPVERVSWNAIQGFCSVTGMRLPTEAEWEFACRAGTQTPFYNGSTDDSTVVNLAWYSANAANQTRPVGGKAANAFGFHDMLGNAREWVNDWSGSYTANAQTDPTGPAFDSARMIRGGSFGFLARDMRSSVRNTFPPSVTGSDIGFRVARNP